MVGQAVLANGQGASRKDFLPDKTDLHEKANLLPSLSFLLVILSEENGIVGEMCLGTLRGMAATRMATKWKDGKKLWSLVSLLVCGTKSGIAYT